MKKLAVLLMLLSSSYGYAAFQTDALRVSGASVTIQDPTSSANIFITNNRLPINGGFGPQVSNNYLWSTTEYDSGVYGGFSIISSTASFNIYGGGSPNPLSLYSAFGIYPNTISMSVNDEGGNNLSIISATNSNIQMSTVVVTGVMESGAVKLTNPSALTYPILSPPEGNYTGLIFNGSNLCIWVNGSEIECWTKISAVNYARLEDNTYILLEDGTRLRLEQ